MGLGCHKPTASPGAVLLCGQACISLALDEAASSKQEALPIFTVTDRLPEAEQFGRFSRVGLVGRFPEEGLKWLVEHLS